MAQQLLCRKLPFLSISDLDFPDMDGLSWDAELRNADGSAIPEQRSTKICAYYSEQYFIVFFSGSYEQLRVSEAVRIGSKTERLWEDNDVYELFIGKDAAAVRRYVELQISPDGKYFDSAVYLDEQRSDHSWNSGMEGASFVNMEKKIWRAFIAVPWKSIGCAPGETQLDLNIYRATGQFHGDELFAWSPTGYGPKCFHRPQYFGRILFHET